MCHFLIISYLAFKTILLLGPLFTRPPNLWHRPYPLQGTRVYGHGSQMSCLDSHNKFRKRWRQARGQLSRCPALGSRGDSEFPAVFWRQAPGHPETHGQAAGGRAGSWLEELAAGTSWIQALGHSQGCLVGVEGEGGNFIQPALRRAPGQVPAICQS